MTRPRFKLGSLTGYTIRHDGTSGRREVTEWYVLDRGLNYRVVARHIGQGARKRAFELCERLNGEHECLR